MNYIEELTEHSDVTISAESVTVTYRKDGTSLRYERARYKSLSAVLAAAWAGEPPAR